MWNWSGKQGLYSKDPARAPKLLRGNSNYIMWNESGNVYFCLNGEQYGNVTWIQKSRKTTVNFVKPNWILSNHQEVREAPCLRSTQTKRLLGNHARTQNWCTTPVCARGARNGSGLVVWWTASTTRNTCNSRIIYSIVLIRWIKFLCDNKSIMLPWICFSMCDAFIACVTATVWRFTWISLEYKFVNPGR